MDEAVLLKRIDAFADENREAIVRDMKRLVDIESVEGAPEPGAPFGPGPRRALDEALAIAREMGLETGCCDGYVGWPDVPGASSEQIALITHLDVVPAGSGWTSEPFCMTVRDGFAVGRGTSDDKGPAIVTLYAAKFYRELGCPLPRTLRILLGTNEETGMRDVNYYLKHHPQPAFCFSPDSRFPVGYAEKGGCGGWLVSGPVGERIVELSGGRARNAVADEACALVKTDAAQLPSAPRVDVRTENGLARIESHGKSGHAAGRATQ